MNNVTDPAWAADLPIAVLDAKGRVARQITSTNLVRYFHPNYSSALTPAEIEMEWGPCKPLGPIPIPIEFKNIKPGMVVQRRWTDNNGFEYTAEVTVTAVHCPDLSLYSGQWLKVANSRTTGGAILTNMKQARWYMVEDAPPLPKDSKENLYEYLRDFAGIARWCTDQQLDEIIKSVQEWGNR